MTGSRAPSGAASHGAFLGAAGVLFLLSSVATVVGCRSMSAMGKMQMPGGWGMSMAWVRMPGQTWLGLAASSLGMWLVMMVAMMLPCLVPMLLRYRRTARAGETHLERLTTLVGAGYFFVWSVLGMAVLLLGFGLAGIEMQQPALARVVPFTSGILVLLAGALQFSAWKTRHLTRCRDLMCSRETPAFPRGLPADSGAAWRHGLRLGLHCCRCCINLLTILLVVGIMDLPAMALVTVALTLERVAPFGDHVARAVGVAVIGAGLLLIVRAAGLG